jgi:hypothetical protein
MPKYIQHYVTFSISWKNKSIFHYFKYTIQYSTFLIAVSTFEQIDPTSDQTRFNVWTTKHSTSFLPRDGCHRRRGDVKGRDGVLATAEVASDTPQGRRRHMVGCELGQC